MTYYILQWIAAELITHKVAERHKEMRKEKKLRAQNHETIVPL